MKWIGLTGGMGSGKSAVARMLTDRSYVVVDADRIAYEVVEKGTTGLQSVVRIFGHEILTPTGELDRPKLGRMVFGDPERLEKLEAALHPLIRTRALEIRQQLVDQGVKIAFYDVPLLFEKSMESQFSAVVVVNATPELQVARIQARTSLSPLDIQMRLASQIPLKRKVEQAHFVIQNDGDFAHLEREVERMLIFVSQL